MISYAPFFQTLLDRNVTIYYLVFKQGMSSNTFQRMREGEPITTATIDTLCSILRCTVSDIIEYKRTTKRGLFFVFGDFSHLEIRFPM